MKLSLQLKLGQQLTMTPQLQQAIKLLQLSTLDLQQEIHQVLESNPMLELVEDSDEVGNDDNSGGEPREGRDTDHSATDSGEPEWAETIPGDLSVDTNWDDVYQTTYTTGSGSPEPEAPDFESRNAESETLQDHLFWQHLFRYDR